MDELPATDLAEALCREACARISVQSLGSVIPQLVVDTPHVLQNGEQLQIFVEPRQEGGFLVHDGGLILEDLSLVASSKRTYNSRRRQIIEVADAWDLAWNDRFEFYASDLDALSRRVAVIAIATDQALSLLGMAQKRAASGARKKLTHQLNEAGAKVSPRARLPIGNGNRFVTVDLTATRGSRQAAVEVMGGTRPESARSSVNQAIVNLQLVLGGGQFGGDLFGVYEEDSLAADAELLDRFETLLSGRVRLLGSRNAAAEIADALAA